jgi:GNAT superfamily N-acetyltransferase
LLNAPAVRAYVLEDWPGRGIARWAATASQFVAQVRESNSALLGIYIRDLLPCVARTVAPAASMLRLPRRDDFHLAVHDPRRDDLRLSLLGPLAMFFLESVARAEVAWDVLVEPQNVPARAGHFGWALALDSLAAAMRLILTGQAGRRLRGKALMYSPLARYLLELGLVQRVAVAPRADGTGGGRRLLSGQYISCAQGHACVSGLVLEDTTPPPSWELEETAVDRRTGRRVPTPQENLELIEVRDRLLAAARTLVGRYADPARPQIKRLAMWAHAADVVTTDLLCSPESLSEEILASLVEAALRRRTRHTSIRQLNATIRQRDFASRIAPSTPVTASQCRTYLSRIRQEFRSELGQLL